MNIILDLAVAAIIILSVVIGYNRGLIKSVMGLASGIIAIILALALTPALSGFINDNFVHPAISSFVEQKIVSVTPSQKSDDESVQEMIEDRPSEFQDVLDFFGMTFDELKTSLFGDKKDTAPAQTGSESNNGGLVKEAGMKISKNVSGLVSSVIAFLIIYILSLVILKIVTSMLNGLFSLPVLKTSNKVLGALIGLVTGVLSCFIVCTVVARVLPYLAQTDNPFFANVTSDKTLLFGFFSSFDNLKELIAKFVK